MLVAALVLTLLLQSGLALRPSNETICDYYTMQRYGTNNSTTQAELIQHIVALAFGGGFNISEYSDITGILNPGNFTSTDYGLLQVDLRPWFNGSIDSTNLNDQPVGIDWLTLGLDPLYDYLANITQTVVLSNTSNQYTLFSHFFSAFANIFGCTLPPATPSTSTGMTSLAYVHKFMNLNYTDLGHFIDQLTKSTAHFGFSAEDIQTLSTSLNSQYNVACAPPVNGELYSLCQASNCPLAAPSADCAAYVNLTADGTVSSASSVTTPIATFVPSSVTPISSTIASSAVSSVLTSTSTGPGTAISATSTPTPSPSPSLSSGAIAGIVIGGVAGVSIIAAAIYFGLRRRSSNTYAVSSGGATSNNPYSPFNPSFTSQPSHASPQMAGIQTGHDPNLDSAEQKDDQVQQYARPLTQDRTPAEMDGLRGYTLSARMETTPGLAEMHGNDVY